MRLLVLLVVSGMALGGTAQAQTPSAPEPAKGYVVGGAQWVGSGVTSVSYGAEIGFTLMPRRVPNLQVFVDLGRIANVATPAVLKSAQVVIDYLNATEGSAAYSAREPVAFGAIGLRYALLTNPRVQPYAMGGFGGAQVKHNVTFSLRNTDVTGNLAQYGVTLGSDLSGTFIRPALTLGGGIVIPAWRRVIVDLQYRFLHTSTADDGGINAHRAGIGFGVRF